MITYIILIVAGLFLLIKLGSWAFPKYTWVTDNNNHQVKKRIVVKKFVPIIAWIAILASFGLIGYPVYKFGQDLFTKPTQIKQSVSKKAGIPTKIKTFTNSQYDSATPTELYNTYDSTGKKALDSFFDDQDEENYALSLIGKSPLLDHGKTITLNSTDGSAHKIGKGQNTLICVLSTDSDNSQEELSVINTLETTDKSNVTILVVFPVSARSDVESLYSSNSYTMKNVIMSSGNSKYTNTQFQNIFLNWFSVTKVPTFIAIDSSGRVSLAGYGYKDQDTMSQFISTAFSNTPLYDYMTKPLKLDNAALPSSTNSKSSSSSSSSKSSSSNTKASSSSKNKKGSLLSSSSSTSNK